MAVVKTSFSMSPKMAADVEKHWFEFGYSNRNDFITTAILLQIERDRLKREDECSND